MYTEDSLDKLAEKTVPEMQRSNMATVVLQLKALGINNVLRFDFLSPPPAQNMIRGLEILYALGALGKILYTLGVLGEIRYSVGVLGKILHTLGALGKILYALGTLGEILYALGALGKILYALGKILYALGALPKILYALGALAKNVIGGQDNVKVTN